GAVIGATRTLGRMPGMPVRLRRYFDGPCSLPRCSRARGFAGTVVRTARDGCYRRAGIRVNGVSRDVGRRTAVRGAPDLDFRAGITAGQHLAVRIPEVHAERWKPSDRRVSVRLPAIFSASGRCSIAAGDGAMSETAATRKAALGVGVLFLLGAALGGVLGYLFAHRPVNAANPPLSEPERRARRVEELTRDLTLTPQQAQQV